MANIFCFESTDAGAPSTNNAAGALIALLDACLINGYNNKSVTSITVSAGVATVVCTAHGFSANYGKIIAVSGAAPAGLNISTRITDVTTNGFKYPCPGVADGVATGTIVAKYAPVGWTKPFSATNKAMYKRGDILASNCMLRVDDTNPVSGFYAKCLMVQGATDLDTYYNAGPTIVQSVSVQAAACYKSANTAAPIDWVLLSDGLIFYFFCKPYAAGNTAVSAYHAFVFGDVVSFKPADTLNCVLGGDFDGASNTIFNGAVGATLIVAGASNGVLSNAYVGLKLFDLQMGSPSYAPPYPSSVDGGLLVSHGMSFLFEGGSATLIRGILPGLAVPLHATLNALPSMQRITPSSGSSRVFVPVQVNSNSTNTGAVYCPLFDLTGPWR